MVPTAASSDPWLGVPLPLLFHHDARRRANRRMTPRSSCPSFPSPSMKCPNRKLSEHSLTQNLKRCSQAALDRRPGVPPAPHIGIRKRTGRADMRPKDTKDRDLGNFDNSPNFNWRSIFLFVAYTSVVLGFFLFSRNEKERESAIQNRETRSASAVRSACGKCIEEWPSESEEVGLAF